MPSSSRLQRAVTSLVGRVESVAALREAVEANAVVSVTGAPGVGKSRLVNSVVWRAKDDGVEVCYCNLQHALGPTDVVVAIGLSLGLKGRSSADTVGNALQHREALLVLDDIDGCLAACRDLVEGWTRDSGGARFVATARSALGLPGEAVVEVHPLAERDAKALFAERAALVGAVSWTDEENTHIDALIRQLDGLPLAIELAAARCRMLSPVAILHRLKDRFRVLRPVRSGGSSLEAAIGLSWSLLGNEARETLRQLCVFDGGFSIEAAESVVVGAQCEESLETLVLASMLRVDMKQQRFHILASIRDYVRLKAEGDLLAAAAARHRRYYLDRGERALASLQTKDWSAGLAFLNRETDNLLAAQRSTPAPLDERTGLIVAGSLEAIGAIGAAYDVVTVALSQDETSVSVRGAAARISVQLGYSDTARWVEDSSADHPELVLSRAKWLYHSGGDLLEANQTYKRAVGLLQDHGLAFEGARENLGRGHLCLELGHVDEAVQCFLAAETMFRELHRDAWVALTGIHLRQAGDVDNLKSALDYQYSQLMDLAEQFVLQGDQGAAARSRLNASFRLIKMGRLKEGRALCASATNEALRLGDRSNGGYGLHTLACVEQLLGCNDKALTYHRDAVGMSRADIKRLPSMLASLAGLEMELGLLAAASVHLDEALALPLVPARRIGPLALKAALFALRGEGGLAATHFADVRQLVGECQEANVALYGIEKLDVLELFVPLAEARTRRAQGDERGASAAIASIKEGLAGFGERTRLDVPLALAMRLFKPYWEAVLAQTGDTATAGRFALEIGPDARWFRIAGGDKVSLARRKAMRSLLHRLVDEAHRNPENRLAVSELAAAGWPGERLLPESGASRVYTAVRSLRKMGLKDILESDGGYRLDPGVLLVHRTAPE
jgi:predicted ATPase